MSLPPSVGIVLAAGASRRMGSPKPLLPLEDETYLERVLARLRAAGLESCLVVLGDGADRIAAEVGLDADVTVVNPDWARGMLCSLQSGLRRAVEVLPRADAAVVAPVDIPRFAPETVRALIEARARTRAPVVVPVYRGEHGHPVLFGREVWQELLLPHPARGARAVVDAHRDELAGVVVDDPWVLRDADTPADHARMSGADGAGGAGG